VGAGVALAVALASGARGATITVNATADSLASDGNCTLHRRSRAHRPGGLQAPPQRETVQQVRRHHAEDQESFL
jgi:hypothetical protein